MLRRQARPSRGAAKLDSTKQQRLGDWQLQAAKVRWLEGTGARVRGLRERGHLLNVVAEAHAVVYTVKRALADERGVLELAKAAATNACWHQGSRRDHRRHFRARAPQLSGHQKCHTLMICAQCLPR